MIGIEIKGGYIKIHIVSNGSSEIRWEQYTHEPHNNETAKNATGKMFWAGPW